MGAPYTPTPSRNLSSPVPDLRVGSISDARQLTLAMCEGVMAAKGEVRPDVIAEHFVRWQRERGFDVLLAPEIAGIAATWTLGSWR